MTYNYRFDDYIESDGLFHHVGTDLISDGFGGTVDTGHWQALTDVPHTQSIEMRNVLIEYPIPPDMGTLQTQLFPNLPWAEDHFQERVDPDPENLNPGVQYKNWPWYAGGVEGHKQSGKFSHTYMERYWPKQAGDVFVDDRDMAAESKTNLGLRYPYGDLDDVVSLLAKHPGTRQAYLPVWFPEDTGAVHGERVPCSLGYHWLLREGRLHCNYFIRSCDFLRYLRDDMYLTCRLTQWIMASLEFQDIPDDQPPAEEKPWAWDGVVPGDLTMFIGSLHVFEGDLPKMRRLYG